MAFIKGQGMHPISYIDNAAQLQVAGGLFAGTFWIVVVLAVGAFVISTIRRRDP